MLWNHHHLWHANSSLVRWLLYCPLPAYREEKQGLQKDAPSDRSRTKVSCIKMNGKLQPNKHVLDWKKKKHVSCLNVWKHIRISRKHHSQAFQICIMKKDIFQSDFYFSVPSHIWYYIHGLKYFLKLKNFLGLFNFIPFPGHCVILSILSKE